MIASTFLKVQKVIIKNAPTILTVCGALGAGASVALAINGTLKCQRILSEYEREQDGPCHRDCVEARYLLEQGDDAQTICDKLGKTEYTKEADDAENYISDLVKIKPMSTGDKIWMYIRSYAPAVITLGLSIGCIFGANHINKVRMLQLAGAYALSRKELKEYKDKVKETIGDKKFNELSDSIVQDKILKNPPTEANTITPNMSNVPNLSLWYDDFSDRYFYSNADYIRRAETEANVQLNKYRELSPNDIYNLLGIKDCPAGDDVRWRQNDDNTVKVILKIGTMLDDKQQPVGTMEMNSAPSSDYFVGD